MYYAAGIDESKSDLKQYRRIFEQYDIPQEKLYCGELVESTFHEAQAFKRKLQEVNHPVEKIVLVSDRYHLRRGIWSFRQVLGKDIEIAAHSTPSSPEMADPQWWKHPEARDFVFSETKKMVFYFLYYNLLNQQNLITHGDVNRITKGKVAKGISNPCQVVLPQLTQR